MYAKWPALEKVCSECYEFHLFLYSQILSSNIVSYRSSVTAHFAVRCCKPLWPWTWVRCRI